MEAKISINGSTVSVDVQVQSGNIADTILVQNAIRVITNRYLYTKVNGSTSAMIQTDMDRYLGLIYFLMKLRLCPQT